MTREFDETRRFEGVKYRRWPDMNNSPVEQSAVTCTCGANWNAHRFSDGACPRRITPQESDSQMLAGRKK